MSRTAYSHSRSSHNTFFDEVNERFDHVRYYATWELEFTFAQTELKKWA